MLYRLGRFSARRPWTVIGAWLVASVLVIGAAGAFGRELEDSFEVPGVDSQRAAELLERAGSDRAGLTAQLVLTPRDGALRLARGAGSARAGPRARSAALPNVLGTSDPAVSENGRVARIEVRYPVLADVSRGRPRAPEGLRCRGQRGSAAAPRDGRRAVLRLRGEQPGRADRRARRRDHPASWPSARWSRWVCRSGSRSSASRVGIGAMSLVAYVVDIPSWAPQLGSMVGLGVGHRLRAVPGHPAPGEPRARARPRGVDRPGGGDRRTGRRLRGRHGRRRDPRPGRRGRAVRDGRRHRDRAHRRDHGAGVDLAAAGVPSPGRARGSTGSASGDGAARGAPARGWRRWGAHVSRHPWAYVLVAAPRCCWRWRRRCSRCAWAAPTTARSRSSRTERRAYDLAAAGFGAGSNGPLVIAVDVARGARVRRAAAASGRRRRRDRGRRARRDARAASRP